MGLGPDGIIKILKNIYGSATAPRLHWLRKVHLDLAVRDAQGPLWRAGCHWHHGWPRGRLPGNTNSEEWLAIRDKIDKLVTTVMPAHTSPRLHRLRHCCGPPFRLSSLGICDSDLGSTQSNLGQLAVVGTSNTAAIEYKVQPHRFGDHDQALHADCP